MAELTGEAAALPGSPLSTPSPSAFRARAQPSFAPQKSAGGEAVRPAPRLPDAQLSTGAPRQSSSMRRQSSSINFDDIDIEIADPVAPAPAGDRRSAAPTAQALVTPRPREPAAVALRYDEFERDPSSAALARTGGAADLDLNDFDAAPARTETPAGAEEDRPSSALPPPPPDDEVAGDPEEADASAAVRLGAFKTSLNDPFDGVDLGGQNGGASVELSGAKPAAARRAQAVAQPREARPPPEAPFSTGSEIVSSALTGLVGAALAIAVLLAAAVSENGGEALRLVLGGGEDVVASRLVSGLYDTAAGQPVFFVRGRVENRGKKPRGPVRVIAELVSDNGADGRAEALAGLEPSPEEVYALRTPAEAEKLVRSLAQNEGDRKIPPGGSLPFFALIRDPPRDLEHHRLNVRLEAVDAWAPPIRSAQGSR